MDESNLRVKLVEQALRSVERGDDFDSMFNGVLTSATDAFPSPVWDRIRDIDRDADVRALTAWSLRKLTDNAPEDLSALWFGLYEIGPVGQYPQGAEAVLQLSGGPGYPDDPQWLFKQNWYSDGYAPTPGLRSLLAIGASEGDYVFGVVSYAIVLSYAMGLVITSLEQADPTTILRHLPQLGIAAGFHDGDIAQLGVLTPSGLHRSGVEWI